MTRPSSNPCLYHITHVDNLEPILKFGGLLSDAQMLERSGPAAGIGMSKIKQRRLSLPVKCHPGDRVGEYVPFYFCPRSVMLYVIHCGNHPELTYRGGQAPILHLEADLGRVVEWAEREGRRWAFTKANAGAYYCDFWCRLEDLQEVNWDAVAARDFRLPDVREGKQAEFLVRRSVPWSLVSRVGVRTMQIAERVEAALASAGHATPVEVRPEWYY